MFYCVAIGPHFVAVAHDMWRKFPFEYNKYGRFILAGGIIGGWIVALATELTPLLKSIIFSLVSGAMIFTVFKHELSDEKVTCSLSDSCWAFHSDLAAEFTYHNKEEFL